MLRVKLRKEKFVVLWYRKKIEFGDHYVSSSGGLNIVSDQCHISFYEHRLSAFYPFFGSDWLSKRPIQTAS